MSTAGSRFRLVVVLAAVLSVGVPLPATGEEPDPLTGLRRAPEGPRAGYDRDLFDHWTDADGDGCNTRREVLIAESTVPAAVGPGCAVSGQWFSAYDGMTTEDPTVLQVDHVVALAEAWDSGAAGWDPVRRREFANDLGFDGSLIAVSAASNQAKSDLEPAEWLPPRLEDRCRFASDWVQVKVRWELSADDAEASALDGILARCRP